ncbi:hypothetical protein GE061_010385 [Apolygus lucorum]|uniref:MARVEL domain-containing protein n=1 Tax=Apolygus lucorum TaxID=248454 RepID=A0A8S9Y4F0_APOLU|nr:hypothetical protein GE061_010385 [Apolygus lucorum]
MVIPVTGPVGIMPVTGPDVVIPMTGPGAIAPKTKPEAVVHLAEPETDTPVSDPEVSGPMAEPEMVAPVTGPGATVPMAGFEASVPVVGSGVDVPVAEPVGSIPVAGPETIVPLTEPRVVIPVTESKAIIPISGPVGIVPMIGTEGVIPVAELLGTVPMTDPCMEGAVGDVGCPVALCPAGNPELRRVGAVLDSDPKIECWDGEGVDHRTEAETNLWQRGAEPLLSIYVFSSYFSPSLFFWFLPVIFPDYVKTVPGMLKCVQIILSLLVFICVSFSMYSAFGRLAFMSFICGLGFWLTGVLLAFYLFHVIEKFYTIPWLKIEFGYCIVWTLFLMIGSTLSFAYLDAASIFGVVGFFGTMRSLKGREPCPKTPPTAPSPQRINLTMESKSRKPAFVTSLFVYWC